MLSSFQVATEPMIRHVKAFAHDLETCIFCGRKTLNPIDLWAYKDNPGVMSVMYECVSCGNFFEADFRIEAIKGSKGEMLHANE